MRGLPPVAITAMVFVVFTGFAFVLIQHLPPERESMVAQILARHTKMPVAQVEDGMAIERDHVYVIRPGHTLTIHEGKLRLGEPVEKPGHRRPVDDFFRSLAEEQRERAICIVMSGMGSNGTAGAQIIKAVGGLCIAQDPETAQHPSMPRSLIAAGADVNAVQQDGVTPLHETAATGQLELTRLLLEHGADRNVKDGNGRTPADSARERRH